MWPRLSVAHFGTLTGLLAIGAGSALRAQTTGPLARAVEEQLPALGVPGAVWALVFPDSTQLGAAGVRDLESRVPMTPDTRVQVGSVTKTLVATGVLQLATRGPIDLDAPVSRYLPDLPIDNPWEASAPIRVRHLLDHTSGLGDAHLWQVFSERGSPDLPLRDAIVRPGRRLRLQAKPGVRFSYSNTGYALLALVIEQRTGDRYETWLDRELLTPLGMHHSTFQFVTQSGASADTSLAMGHFEGGTNRASFAIPVRPATQFTTTASDMARLARFLMSAGRVGERVLVDSALLAAMARPTTTDAVAAGLSTGYGLGLQSRDRWGALTHGHVGNSGTFRAAFYLYPGQQRAFFVSYNSDPEQAAWDRVDSLLAATLAPDTLPTPGTGATGDVARWAGWYLQRPSRFEQFAYLDALASLIRVRTTGDTLMLIPLGGTARALVPVDSVLWRLTTRRLPTHALIEEGSHLSVTDGQRTLDRVPTLTVWRRWITAAAGFVALLTLLVRGLVVTIRAWRSRRVMKEPLTWTTLAFVGVVCAVLALVQQPFLAIGDPTGANIALATASGLLALATAAALLGLLLPRVQPTGAGAGPGRTFDVVVLALAMQWFATLAFWGLLPLRLWA